LYDGTLVKKVYFVPMSHFSGISDESGYKEVTASDRRDRFYIPLPFLWKEKFMRSAFQATCICAFLLIPFFSPSSFGSDPQLLKKQASWAWPDGTRIQQLVISYLSTQLTGEERVKAEATLQASAYSNGVGLLDAILASTSLAEPSIANLQQLLSEPFGADTTVKIDAQLSSILANGSIPNWLKTDLQLMVCRYQVQHDLFDEALQKLLPMAQESNSDPATWLFCMAICQHHLMERTTCLETLDKLLERETELPTRYAVTARLMQADINPLKADSLDEIARLMNDVERRLTLGRTGKVVREKEQAIVDKLDKIIDKLEQQQQQQNEQDQQKKDGNGGQQNKKPSTGKPMEASQLAELNAPGDVDQKNIGDGSGWGNLPPAQRQEALQNMTKDLPSHYREVIEAYFKRLATNQNP
jgi:hypothetical protein